MCLIVDSPEILMDMISYIHHYDMIDYSCNNDDI